MKQRANFLGGCAVAIALASGCASNEAATPRAEGCAQGQTQCGEACVFVDRDPAHCGGCNTVCAASEVCSLGACSSSCAQGLTQCGGSCVDTQSDSANCGVCGQACGAGQSCSAGTCVAAPSGGGNPTAGGMSSSAGTGGASTGAATSGGTGTGGNATAGNATAGSAAAGNAAGGGEPLSCATDPNPGDGGVVIDGCCVVLCAQGDLTDADSNGATDGWGWELQAECVVSGSSVAAGQASCAPDPRTDLPEPGEGYWFPEVGDPPEPKCVPPCDDPASDAVGEPDGDGWGWEHQDTCIVPGSRPAAEGIPCVVESSDCNGDGYLLTIDGEETCLPPCQYGALTDVDDTCMPDGDGWGYEQGANCLVPGSPAAPESLCCNVTPRTGLPPAGSGYMADSDESGVFGDSADEVCMPPCGPDASYEEGCDGWGYEGGLSCIDPDGIAAAQLVPCVYEALTTDPPPGDGWDGDYTTTFFGEADCQSQGADDLGDTNINFSACVGNGAVSLNGDNQTWFGALGDHSSFWEGGECTCPGGQSSCVPTCPSDTCGRCFEVACNPGGTYYHPDDANQDTHNGLCRTDQSVVVQLIDVCPHNHSNNTYWCTDQRPNHIDVSCTAFSAITNGRQDIDNIGSLNAWVRPVDCSVGLGVKQIR